MYLNKNYNTLLNTKLSYSACDRPRDIFLCFICITSKMYSIMVWMIHPYIRLQLTNTCAVLNTQETKPSCPAQWYLHMCHPQTGLVWKADLSVIINEINVCTGCPFYGKNYYLENCESITNSIIISSDSWWFLITHVHRQKLTHACLHTHKQNNHLPS